TEVTFDVIEDIFIRLPVKHLLFRWLSKTSCGLLDGQDFINHHLQLSIKTHSNLNLVLNNLHLYSVDLDSLLVIHDDAINSLSLDSLAHVTELEQPNDGAQVIASCNNWICTVNIEDEIVLSNKTTNECHVVPDTSDELPHLMNYEKQSSPFYGFGYDSINDDYKVLRVQQFVSKDCNSFKSEATLYSVQRNSWRKTKGIPYYIHNPQEPGVLIGGTLHWLASAPSCNVPCLIRTFDVAAEKYSVVPLSEGIDHRHRLTLRVLGGRLCVIRYGYKVGFHMWVMEDCMVEESWTKLLS
ncbi:LOW QUALITY PROTEIN: FBA_3 domain-containing protein, partial [Cephalotus follicularis]